MEKQLDLLIVKPGNPQKIYGDLSKDFAGIEPPIWGALVASFIRSKGHSVSIFDMEVEGLDIETTAEKIVSQNPVLVNISVMGPNPSASSTPLMPTVTKLTHTLKQKNRGLKIILTGIHPSALPEKSLQETNADFVGQGENFYTILHLLEILKTDSNATDFGGEADKTNLLSFPVKGLWYLKNNEIVSNGWGETVKNLDDLPMTAWDLLPMEKYRAHNWHCFDHIRQRQPYAVVYTSLGCPNNCTYCNIRTYYDGKPGIRFRSPEKVVEEIDYLVKNYKIKNIKFLDELFAIGEERVNKICDLIIAGNYDLNIWAYARIDTVNERMLAKMKKAGIRWVCYGIESGSKKVRLGVSKIGFDKDKIREVIDMTKKAGVYILGNFIFGLPDDDFETMRETYDLAKELNCEYVNFYATMAYPGSKLYEDAVKQGIPLPSNWLGFAQLNEDTLPLPTKYISGSDVLRFRDKAFKDYCTNQEYLKMIEEKFEKEVVDHIKLLLSHDIKRKFA